jgi:hypothetical protein
MEGDGYTLVRHAIPQLAGKLSTWAAHMENKSEPDYSLGFAVSRHIQFDEHGYITVPEHVKPLVFNENEHEAPTPTGSRHEQRRKKRGAKKVKRREGSDQHPALEELSSSDLDTNSDVDEGLSAAPGDDLDPEDQPPGTVKKASSAEARMASR